MFHGVYNQQLGGWIFGSPYNLPCLLVLGTSANHKEFTGLSFTLVKYLHVRAFAFLNVALSWTISSGPFVKFSETFLSLSYRFKTIVMLSLSAFAMWIDWSCFKAISAFRSSVNVLGVISFWFFQFVEFSESGLVINLRRWICQCSFYSGNYPLNL